MGWDKDLDDTDQTFAKNPYSSFTATTDLSYPLSNISKTLPVFETVDFAIPEPETKAKVNLK